MICYEVRLNGRRLCTAGMPGYGVLGVDLSWVKRDPAWRRKGAPKLAYDVEEHHLSVGGLFRNERLRWVERRIRAGDTLHVRILRRSRADPPNARHTKPDPPPDTIAYKKSEAIALERKARRMRKEVARMQASVRRKRTAGRSSR